jgi:hypothetical protein
MRTLLQNFSETKGLEDIKQFFWSDRRIIGEFTIKKYKTGDKFY